MGAGASLSIRPRIAANSALGTATSASWKITYQECFTTFAPIFTSFSLSVVSVQCCMLLGRASRVLRELAEKVPPWVGVVYAGLPGPRMLNLLEEREKVVIVDAVDAGHAPGTVYRFLPDEASPAGTDRCASLHEGNVLLYVKLAEVLGTGPKEVVVIGIQPADLSPGEKLSPLVEKAVAKAAELVLAEVGLQAQLPKPQRSSCPRL